MLCSGVQARGAPGHVLEERGRRCWRQLLHHPPPLPPLHPRNFNYACVMLGGTILLAMIAWVVSARKWFKVRCTACRAVGLGARSAWPQVASAACTARRSATPPNTP